MRKIEKYELEDKEFWYPNPNINILVGANGSEKSTALMYLHSDFKEYCKIILINEYTFDRYINLESELERLENELSKKPKKELLFYQKISEIFDKKMTRSQIYKLSFGEKRFLYLLFQAFSNQKSVFLIDNIEMFLDVKKQKRVLGLMKELSPNSQFIVSTHSPIIILGATYEKTTIWKMEHTEKGISIKNMNYLNWHTFTPNLLLSSPLFDFDDFFPIAYKDTHEIRTEDSYKEVEINDKRKEELKEIAERMKNKQKTQ